jgi:Cytochrome P450.
MAIAAVLASLQGSVIEYPHHSLAAAALLVPILYVILNEFIRDSARVKGMKGPRGLPLVGNLAQIRTDAAERYRLWSKKYGAVYQIQLGNIPVIVVNSAASAKVLFSQNAQALSSRPETYTFHKVSGLFSLISFYYFIELNLIINSLRLFPIRLERQSVPHPTVIP